MTHDISANITVRDVLRVVETLAPAALAEPWDNVGLLVGDHAQQVKSVLVALDVTSEVLDQADAQGVDLLLTHHPVPFTGMKRIVEGDGTANLVRRLIRGGRSLIAAHTNLDSAPEGLNAYVASLLQLTGVSPLLPSAVNPFVKLVVYVPQTHADVVREAICDAGAGHIGHYSACTFGTQGIGTFRPENGAQPYTGTIGQLSHVAEVRLETIVPRAILSAVLTAMQVAHPYEEVAYDVFTLETAWPGAGLGRIGHLATPRTASSVCAMIRDVLGTDYLGMIGDPQRVVDTIALCTGSGGELLPYALGAGADLYLTGELNHHQALEAHHQGLSVIVAGHFATERPAVPLLSDYLLAHCPALRVLRATEADPLPVVTTR